MEHWGWGEDDGQRERRETRERQERLASATAAMAGGPLTLQAWAVARGASARQARVAIESVFPQAKQSFERGALPEPGLAAGPEAPEPAWLQEAMRDLGSEVAPAGWDAAIQEALWWAQGQELLQELDRRREEKEREALERPAPRRVLAGRAPKA